jgi:hypothetical protein
MTRMLSILNPDPVTEPNTWAFLAGKDSVSVFLQNCEKALYVLVLVAAIVFWVGLVWWAIASPAENWWHILIAAILLILPQGWGEPFLDRTGRWAPVWVIGPGIIYLLLVEPVGPFLLLAAFGFAWAIARAEIVSASEWTEVPRWIRKVVAAVLRAVREAALLIAAGFAFALVTQIYVIIWSGFGRYALWIWEGLVLPLSRLPAIKLKYAAVALLVMMLLTLLDPRTGWVRRWLGAIKTYKRFVALFTAMASFTFYTSSSVNALHRELLEKARVQVGPAPTSEQAARRAAYIVWRLEIATPEEKRRLAEELRKLPEAIDGEWAAQQAAVTMAGDLNGIGAESFRSEAGDPAPQAASQSVPPVPADKAAAVYTESRQAVVSVLAGVLNSQTGTVHVGNDLLQSVADALLGAVAPAILDNIVPNNLRDVQTIHQWISQRLRRTPPLNVTEWNIEPDWSRFPAEQGVEPPEVRVIPTFAPGDFSEKHHVERSPVELLP